MLRPGPGLATESFEPATGLRNGVLQTVFNPVLRRQQLSLLFRRQELLGGSVAIDWVVPTPGVECTSVALFLPGASRCSPDEGGLVHHLMCGLRRDAPAVACAYFVPACLGGLATTPCVPGSAYCATDHLTHVFEAVSRAHPGVPVRVIAASMGSALFTNWAARRASHARCVHSCLLLCFGGSIRETVRAVDEQWFWARAILRKWKGALDHGRLREFERSHVGFSAESLMRARTLRAWDEATLPLYGFASLERMLDAADVHACFGEFGVPTTILNADDDPICPTSRLREHERAMPNVRVVSTPCGGHLGWIDGFAQHCHWAQRAVHAFVSAS